MKQSATLHRAATVPQWGRSQPLWYINLLYMYILKTKISWTCFYVHMYVCKNLLYFLTNMCECTHKHKNSLNSAQPGP